MKYINYCKSQAIMTAIRENLMKKDVPSINVELTNLLDFT